MTSRSDLARVFAALQVLGTEANAATPTGRTKIALAWDTTYGWTYGPRTGPLQWEPGDEQPPNPNGKEPSYVPDDDERKARHRAAEHHRELTDTIQVLDRTTQTMFRLLDLAVPPNPAEVKNRRTGEYDPSTEAEIVLEGWCALCWTASRSLCPIPKDRNGLRRWKARCDWCGTFRQKQGVDPPRELVEKHTAGKRVTGADITEALKKTANPDPKGKRRKGKRTAA